MTDDAVLQFIRNAQAGKPVQRACVLGKVWPALASNLSRFGIDAFDKPITLEHDRVRHMLIRHSGELEFLRGQQPITPDDIASAQKLLNAALMF